VFFGYRRKASILTTESSDGVISIDSQIPPWIQDQAERYWGYNATHVGILSDELALDRYNAVLESTAVGLEHLGLSAEPLANEPACAPPLDDLDQTPS
jgi:hypothetical protein